MVKTVCLPIGFLPTISWFAAWVQAEHILLDDTLLYKKQTIFNRSYIKTAGGVQPIIVPIKHPYTQFSQTQICYQTAWTRPVIRTIQSAYGKAAYFIYYKDAIFNCLETHHSTLLAYNINIILALTKLLKLPSINYTFVSQAQAELLESALYYPTDKQSVATVHESYYQLFNNFVPNLSVIDLLFNVGIEAKHILTTAELNLVAHKNNKALPM